MSDEYKVPHVHKALIEIRKAVNIDKDGVLPGNMGGRLSQHDDSRKENENSIQIQKPSRRNRGQNSC